MGQLFLVVAVVAALRARRRRLDRRRCGHTPPLPGPPP
jgi:hypothetical protein